MIRVALGHRVTPRLLFVALLLVGCTSGTRAVYPPPTLLASHVARNAYRGRTYPAAVVLFAYPLRPTADPSVWEYRPSLRGLLPPTVEVRFVVPPGGPVSAVVGEVTGFRLDLRRRVTGPPGVAVLAGCWPAP